MQCLLRLIVRTDANEKRERERERDREREKEERRKNKLLSVVYRSVGIANRGKNRVNCIYVRTHPHARVNPRSRLVKPRLDPILSRLLLCGIFANSDILSLFFYSLHPHPLSLAERFASRATLASRFYFCGDARLAARSTTRTYVRVFYR